MPRRLLAIAVLLFGLEATATLVVAQTLEQLTAAAPLIVRGTVTGSRTRVDAYGSVETLTLVQILEPLKGHAEGLVTIWQPGGSVGELSTRVEGAAKFDLGEEVVLFLEPLGEREEVGAERLFVPTALSAAKFVLAHGALGTRRAVRNVNGLGFYLQDVCIAEPILRGGVEDFGAAEDFLARIRGAAGRTR